MGVSNSLASNTEINKFFDIFKNINLGTIIVAIIIIIVAFVIWRIFKTLRRRMLKKSGKDDMDMTSHVLYGVVKGIIVLIAFLCILQNFGVNVTNAVAGLGVAGVVIGFALQDFLKDVIMGIHIMIDKFYEIGDTIEFQGQLGIVTKFSLRTTEIKLLEDHSKLAICNRNIEYIKIDSDMVDIDIPLSYDEDAKYVHETFKKIEKLIAENKNIYSCKYKGTQEFGESAIYYKMRFFCKPSKRLDTRREVLMLIQDELAKANLKIPYKQLDVHFDKE